MVLEVKESTPERDESERGDEHDVKGDNYEHDMKRDNYEHGMKRDNYEHGMEGDSKHDVKRDSEHNVKGDDYENESMSAQYSSHSDGSLVLYPFLVDKKSEIKMKILSPNSHLLRFSDDCNDSDGVLSSLTTTNKVHFILEVPIDDAELRDETGNVRVLAQIDSHYEFVTPAGFLEEPLDDSKEFYSQYLAELTSPDLNETAELSEKIAKLLEGNNFPEYPVPIPKTAHYENFYAGATGVPTHSEVESIVIQFGGSIPRSLDDYSDKRISPSNSDKRISPSNSDKRISPSNSDKKKSRLIMQILGERACKIQDDFFSKIFSERKIFKFKDLKELYKNLVCDEDKKEFKPNHLKPALLLHAYFYSNGPWNNSWVEYGYNPATDRLNYKYQSMYVKVPWKSVKMKMILNDYPDALGEVEKRPSWYLLDECDPNEGFYTPVLYKYFEYYLSTKNTKNGDANREYV